MDTHSIIRQMAPLHAATAFFLLAALPARAVDAGPLQAGAAKVDITNLEAGPANPRLYTRALVLTNGTTTVAIISVDAVAIGEIGYIGNDYLEHVRARIQREIHIPPANVLINASHCHGVICPDVEQRTFQAVKRAAASTIPVRIGVGAGREDRIMENRRLKLKNGKEADVRHAYALPPDDEVAEVGPVDPEIGVVRLDGEDGRTVAVLFNFACHPIQGIPSGGNTADLSGFACKVIEDNLSEGTIALFLQGCAGDVNPIWYKDVDHPRDAEPLGNMLGLSTLQAVRHVQCRDDERLVVVNEPLQLPRANVAQRIIELEGEQQDLLDALRGTSLNLKTFIPLAVKYNMAVEFPSSASYHYLHDEAMGRGDLKQLDATNRDNLQRYVRNVLIMEQLTRNQTNLALLRKHQASNEAAAEKTIRVELMCVRIGDFVLTTFPGELTVQIGLGIKNASPHELTFIAAYTNGYIYYAPTAQQLRNVGGAQEDSDCLLAPQWQEIYERKVAGMLQEL